MNGDKLTFLENEAEADNATEDVVETEQAQPTPEEAPEPEAAAEETGENDDAAPPAVEEPEAKAVPVTALLDEREKRQEAQRRAEEFERRMKEYERKLADFQKPKEEAPDWYQDPDKAFQHQAQRIEQQFEQRRLEQSKFFAEREFGAETVNEALSWFDQNPQYSQQFLTEPSPFHAAVEFYKKQKLLEEVGSDPEKWREQERERLRQELMAEAPAKPKPKAPPASLAKAPARGGDAVDKGSAFDQMFPG